MTQPHHSAEGRGPAITPAGMYAFEISLHGVPATVDAEASSTASPLVDTVGTWTTLDPPRDWLVQPMSVGFDEALERLARLERMFVEPDGAIVWVSPRDGVRWQVDGNAFEKDGKVLLVDLKGSCPEAEFDRLLACFGWPAQRMVMHLVRPGVYLDEHTFRLHAVARSVAGHGKNLRPD